MDVPTSVSLHCRMYYLGHLYDLADLKSQAYVNVLRQCEFGCSSPNMPIDLCPAIDFVYRHLQGHDELSDALVQYCVTQCVSHKLHENAEFRKVAFYVRAFHQDLTKACRDRGYEDDSAAIIIQLPYMHYAPATYASTEDPPISRFEDVVHHYHSTDRFDNLSPKKRQRATFDERQTSPTKALKLQESTEKSVNGLALRQAPEKSASVNSGKQSTLECEAKLPDAPRWQLGTSQKSHQQQPQMIITSRASSQQVAPAQPPPAWGVSSWTQTRVAEAREEERLRKPSGTDISSKAQSMTASLTQEGKAQMRTDAMRNMSGHQLRLASERKQDPLGQHIYEIAEQEAMDKWMLTQAAGGQRQTTGPPLRPALETPIPAATNIMTKLSMRSRFPSSANVLDTDITLEDQDSSIWERRGMAGMNPGLSQVLNTSRNQAKQPQGDHVVEVAAPQKQDEPTLTQPRQKGKQRKAVDVEFNPTFNSLRSVQGSTSYEEAIQQNPSAKFEQGDPFKVSPEANTSPTPAIPSAPLRAIHHPAFPINPGPNSGNHALQDYSMQLFLLEYQHKKRLLMARQEQDPMTYPCSPPVHTSTNLQPALPAIGSKTENETQHERVLRTMPRDVRTTKSPAAMNAGGVVGAAGEPDTFVRDSASNQQHVPSPRNQSHALSGFESQLILLEQQNKKRLLMARQEPEFLLPRTETIVHAAAADSQPPVPELGQTQRIDFKMQLMLLEQQNKKRLLMQRQESSERASAGNPPPMSELGDASFDLDSSLDSPSPVPHHVEPHAALSDSQIQAVLLGPQEKKRLIMARPEEVEQAERVKQEALSPKTVGPSADAGSSSAAAAPMSDGRQGGSTFACQNESGYVDILDSFDFDAFLDNKKMESDGCFDNLDFGGEIPSPSPPLSTADGQDRNGPVARALESYQAQLTHLEENHQRQCMLQLAADLAATEAPRAASRPAAAAAAQDESENDEFVNLHLNAFFTKEDRTEFERRCLRRFDSDASAAHVAERNDLHRDNDHLESGSKRGADSDSDSDAESWVDVAAEPTSSSGAVVGQSSPSSHSSDSEWEIC
jgi:hypothetical protein